MIAPTVGRNTMRSLPRSSSTCVQKPAPPRTHGPHSAMFATGSPNTPGSNCVWGCRGMADYVALLAQSRTGPATLPVSDSSEGQRPPDARRPKAGPQRRAQDRVSRSAQYLRAKSVKALGGAAVRREGAQFLLDQQPLHDAAAISVLGDT